MSICGASESAGKEMNESEIFKALLNYKKEAIESQFNNNEIEAEKMEFPETAPAPVTEADGTVDGAATAEAGTIATDMTDATDSDVAVADSADMPAADTAETPTADAEPATN